MLGTREVAERVPADGLMDWAATRSGPGSPRRSGAPVAPAVDARNRGKPRPRRRWRRRRTSALTAGRIDLVGGDESIINN
jgi:hypothetical protein